MSGKIQVGSRVRFVNDWAHEDSPHIYPPPGTVGTVTKIGKETGEIYVAWEFGSPPTKTKARSMKITDIEPIKEDGEDKAPEREESFVMRKLIERLEDISALELPDAWKPGQAVLISFEMLMVIKEACGMAASALRVRERGTGHE